MEYIKSDIKRKIAMLTITEHCNLDCVYCFEKSKTKKVMDLKTAQKSINFEFNHLDDFDEIEFDVFGGEPTLRKKFIIDIVEWTYGQNYDKPFLFFIETNGTLLDDNFKRWLTKNNANVRIGLSLDGTPETHNKNRSNSYDDIDIDFFVKNYPKQSVRMTVYHNAIDNLSNDIKHLHKLGFKDVLAIFANGVNWNFNNIKKTLSNEFEKLIEFYIENPEIKVCSIFDMQLIDILKKEKRTEQWCGAGVTMVSYSYDGNKYPCQTFQPNATETNKIPINISNINFENIDDFRDPDCGNCAIESICPNCYGINYVERGDLLRRDKELCGITKLRAIATSFLVAKQIQNNPNKLEPNILYQTIEVIEIIHKKLTKLEEL